MAHRRKVDDDSKKDGDPLSITGTKEDSPATTEDLLAKIKELEKKNKDLEEENELLREIITAQGINLEGKLDEIKELRRRVNMNSTNSSKPPSSDGYRKPSPKSQRVKTGRKPGGQPGHTGHGIKLPHASDVRIFYRPEQCDGCPHFDECMNNGLEEADRRFTVDLVLTAKVTEHVVLRHKACPKTETEVVGNFPEGVTGRIQYGDSASIFAGLLNTEGAVSYQRISRLMRSMFGITISPGTIVSMVTKCSDKLDSVLGEIKKRIIDSEVVNFDETGARTEGKLYWVHNSSTPEYTYQTISTKRGIIGIKDNGVLPEFKGVAVHDCWAAYWRILKEVLHATCGAHFLRELTAIEDMEPEHQWPKQFRELLLSMKHQKDEALGSDQTSFCREKLEEFDKRYDEIMDLADRECPPPVKPSIKKRGRVKKGKERALIERFQNLKDSVCMFTHNFKVPFDNNQAERDVRNVKTKIKVSGCFRTMAGASRYLRVMSYLSTARKHGINPHKAMIAAFENNAKIVLQTAD